MVLQREIPVPVWGWADPGSKIAVSFNGQNLETTTGQDGKWLVRLAPLSCPPNNPPQTLSVRGKDGEISLADILIGDIWICAGQSNMAFKLNRVANADVAIRGANDPLVRICRATGKRSALGQPSPDDLESADWQIATPATVPDFSAVGYFFGVELRKSTRIPIGLLDTSVGGTPMRDWMSRESMESDSDLRPEVERCDAEVKNYPKLLDQYQRQFESYQKKVSDGDKEARKPIQPKSPDSSYRMSYFHASIIRPLQPLAIKGVIWYQGEANSTRYEVFEKQFSTLIAEWRREWGQGDFPWLYVQLAPYSDPNGRLVPRTWEAQAKAQEIPKVAMVISLDHGMADNIHPPEKQPIGERLALAARAIAYGENVNWRSPSFKSIEKHGKDLIIHFDNVGSGLVAKEMPLKYFTIAGNDGKFIPAEARLGPDDTVTVSSPKISEPAAVRYGWYELRDPVGASLFGKDGLPVAPFRSDDWPDRK
jgi:sialate O-acetylesterase